MSISKRECFFLLLQAFKLWVSLSSRRTHINSLPEYNHVAQDLIYSRPLICGPWAIFIPAPSSLNSRMAFNRFWAISLMFFRFIGKVCIGIRLDLPTRLAIGRAGLVYTVRLSTIMVFILGISKPDSIMVVQRNM